MQVLKIQVKTLYKKGSTTDFFLEVSQNYCRTKVNDYVWAKPVINIV